MESVTNRSTTSWLAWLGHVVSRVAWSWLSWAWRLVLRVVTGRSALERLLAATRDNQGGEEAEARLREVVRELERGWRDAAERVRQHAAGWSLLEDDHGVLDDLLSSETEAVVSRFAGGGDGLVAARGYDAVKDGLRYIGVRAALDEAVVALKVPYDRTDAEHEDKLFALWDALRPGLDRPERISPKWGMLGFQGRDPATDFRGMGLLALEQLLFVAQSSGTGYLAVLACAEACDEEPFYPFATAGINFTAFALAALRRGDLDGALMAAAAAVGAHQWTLDAAMEVFHAFYARALLALHAQWRAEMPEDIMAFPGVSERVQAAMVARVRLGDLNELLCPGL